MKVEKTLKKFIIYSGIIVLCLLGLILFSDFINITNFIPFTREFDWLNLLGAIIGGVIGAVGTLLGLFLTIKKEQEYKKIEEINKMKRDGYSYLTFGDNPFTLELALDSVTSIANVEEYNSILIGENVASSARFCKMTFELEVVNSNYPSGVIVDDLVILYDHEIKDNKSQFNGYEYLKGYDTKYKKITLKNRQSLVFNSTALINEVTFKKFKKKLLISDKIDIAANLSVINPNGVITHGHFIANLTLDKTTHLGNKINRGSNSVLNSYKATNTYLTINEIEYVENIEDILFK